MSNVINIITHQEIQILYGYGYDGARKRLQAIRAALNKKRKHVLTVIEFCKAEDITLDEFDLMIKRATKRTDKSA